MRHFTVTRWLRLRATFAVVVLGLLVVDLVVGRYVAVEVIQGVLIAGIVATVVLDVREARRRRWRRR